MQNTGANQPTESQPIRWRRQYVFLSSTFRDFHAERDYFVKFVFPELRAWCVQFKVHLIDVDLRWGLTEEQSNDGRILGLCLERVDHCRPFFLGFLGSRYGWTPRKHDLPADAVAVLSEQFPGIGTAISEPDEKTPARSVTHLEVQHAVLGPLRTLTAMESACHAMFYFRHDASLPKAESIEVWDDAQRKEFRAAFFDADDPSKAQRLAALKKRIRQHVGRARVDSVIQRVTVYRPTAGADGPAFDPTATNPEDPSLMGRFRPGSLREFGARVKSDLIDALTARFSDRISVLTEQRDAPPIDNERELQESFVAQRTDESLYVKRPAMIRKLREYLASSSRKILALYGDPGSGKSSILAELCAELDPSMVGAANPQASFATSEAPLLVMHFAGVSPGSTALPTMLFRFCEQLKTRFDLEQEVPADPLELQLTFADFLRQSTAPTVLIIDGLNQLDDFGDALDLHWLPAELPEHVKLITSTLPGRAADALSRKTDECLTISELSPDERRQILSKLPSVSAKILDPPQIDALLSKPGTHNPLYLKLAIEELRVFGGFGRRGQLLIDQITRLPGTVDGMCQFLLERLQRDHGELTRAHGEAPGLVESVFCLLACSRHGLSEEELAALLSHDEERRHQLILRQVREYLQHRGELVDFFHGSLAKAVAARWLAVECEGATSTEPRIDPASTASLGTGSRASSRAIEWHRRLAEFFEQQPTQLVDGAPNARKALELARQAASSQNWEQCCAVLTDLNLIEAKIRADLLLDLHRDYQVLLSTLPEFAQRNADERRQEERVAEYVRAMNELDGSSSQQLEPVQAVVRPSQEHLEREAERLRERPSQGERVRAFAEFIRRHQHQFAGHRVAPGFVAQQALLHADAGPVASAARRLLNAETRTPYFELDARFRPPYAPFPAEIAVLRGHEGAISMVHISTDGKRGVSSDSNGELRVWDLWTGHCVATFAANVSTVSADGSRAPITLNSV